MGPLLRQDLDTWPAALRRLLKGRRQQARPIRVRGGGGTAIKRKEEGERNRQGQTDDNQRLGPGDANPIHPYRRADAAGRRNGRNGLGRLAEAEIDLRTGIELYSSVDNDQGRWHAVLNLADIYRFQGRFTESLGLLEPQLESARMAQRPMRYAGLLLNLAETQIELFRLGEVRDLLAELEGLSVTRTHPRYEVALSLIRGRLYLASKDFKGAISVLQPAVEEADESGFSVIAGQLRGWLGEALSYDGDREGAERETAKALDALKDMIPILGEACGCRARALVGREDPDLIFRPVMAWAQDEPARLIRLTYHLAAAQFAQDCGEQHRSQQHYIHAEGIFNEIGGLLSDGDRSALQVHPIRQQIMAAIA